MNTYRVTVKFQNEHAESIREVCHLVDCSDLRSAQEIAHIITEEEIDSFGHGNFKLTTTWVDLIEEPVYSED